MCFCFGLQPIYFLLTSGWCPAKVKFRATPLFFHARALVHPQNHQPLRRRNRPSYYKHNRAYYRATAIRVLSCSKAYICFIKAPLSVSFPGFSIYPFELSLSATLSFVSLVQITTCSGGWLGNPACKATKPTPASGSMMVVVSQWEAPLRGDLAWQRW